MKALFLALGLRASLANAALVIALRPVGGYPLTHVRVGPIHIDKNGIAIGDAAMADPHGVRFPGRYRRGAVP